MPGYYIKQGNVGIGDAANPDAAALTVQAIRTGDVSIKIDTCGGGTQTGNLIEANGTGGSAVLTVSVAGVISTSAAQYFIDGTSASPSITFSADTDTGIYRPAANQIALATYGSAALLIDGDTAATQQVLLVEPGTSATPALAWSTSATDGMYHYGANQVAIGAAASAIAVFKGGAAVEQIMSKASGTSATPAFSWVADNSTGIYRGAVSAVYIAAGGSAITIVSSSGGLCAMKGGITVKAGDLTVATGCSAVIADAKGLVMAATATPANSSETAAAGTITHDASYIYVCVATNTWKRAALDAW